MVRHSLNYVPWKDRKTVANDLRAIYTAASVTEAETKLLEFAEICDKKYPSIT